VEPRDFPDGRQELWIELIPEAHAPKVCDRCGQTAREIHDVTERCVQDLPVFERETVLIVHRRRIRCATCGPQVERLTWLDRYGRVTRRLALQVARLCRHMPLSRVADFHGLAWSTVKAIHRAYLDATLGPPDLTSVETIILDEFSLHTGHRYATVIVEPTRRAVLWVGLGRGREAIRPFFELLGAEGRARLKAVGMDMNGAYEEEVRAQCPHAEIVFDLFHVVQKYHKEVIRPVRAQEAKAAQAADPTNHVYKGVTWLLFANPDRLTPHHAAKLETLLNLNRRLFITHLLKEDLKQMWDFTDRDAAERFFEDWNARAMESGLEAVKDFARRLAKHLPGILGHCRWKLHTSLLEGMNNTIKVLKRRAYGYRDHAYFFLRIRDAFPGSPPAKVICDVPP
jgi:transposase